MPNSVIIHDIYLMMIGVDNINGAVIRQIYENLENTERKNERKNVRKLCQICILSINFNLRFIRTDVTPTVC